MGRGVMTLRLALSVWVCIFGVDLVCSYDKWCSAGVDAMDLMLDIYPWVELYEMCVSSFYYEAP